MNERARALLLEWIASRVDGEMLWSETSLGMAASFEEWEAGFSISHGQFKAAMLEMGFLPSDAKADIWLFNRVTTEDTLVPTP